MIYIYDILLNFNDGIIYDFYEWNNNDNIENMKRIKMVKISKDDFNSFYNNKVKISSDFLIKIYRTCEVYLTKGIETLDYCFLVSDGTKVLAVECNKDGIIESMSKLLLDEEEEIAMLASNLEFTDIKYDILKEENKTRFMTRKELKIRKYLTNEIKDAYRRHNYNKLKFLYMEYFDQVEENPKKIVDILLNSMNESLDNKHFNLYELLRLSHKKKQV